MRQLAVALAALGVLALGFIAAGLWSRAAVGAYQIAPMPVPYGTVAVLDTRTGNTRLCGTDLNTARFYCTPWHAQDAAGNWTDRYAIRERIKP